MRPRFQFSFGTKINTHATTAGSTISYLITSEIAREVQAARAVAVQRRKSSRGWRKAGRLRGAGAQLRLVVRGETGRVGSSEHPVPERSLACLENGRGPRMVIPPEIRRRFYGVPGISLTALPDGCACVLLLQEQIAAGVVP